jgi:hypothetical protein
MRWWREKFQAPTGTRTPDHPAGSSALYHWGNLAPYVKTVSVKVPPVLDSCRRHVFLPIYEAWRKTFTPRHLLSDAVRQAYKCMTWGTSVIIDAVKYKLPICDVVRHVTYWVIWRDTTPASDLWRAAYYSMLWGTSLSDVVRYKLHVCDVVRHVTYWVIWWDTTPTSDVWRATYYSMLWVISLIG